MSCADEGGGRFPSTDEGDGDSTIDQYGKFSFQTDLLKMIKDVINTTTKQHSL